MAPSPRIRNFCIIAHIDHGKSTLADRFLEFTNTVSKREMKDQMLDQMDIERERGITIKLQPARMNWQDYELNLIDTPGHVDFTYEVSRSLAAVEGAILLVDATQGVQAQTVANLYLALEQGLEIIPVINKIDLPNAQVEKVKEEICHLIGCAPQAVLSVSAKTGQGVETVLQTIIAKVPVPKTDFNAPLRALIFDSNFDEYRGVVAQVRIMDGQVKVGDKIQFISTDTSTESLEVGYFTPKLNKTPLLQAGEIGYIVTGLKEIESCRVGDTITILGNQVEPLHGYKEVKPMVFAGFFCKEGDAYQNLREAIEKLKLNDASLSYEPENSKALGFGFRCGFLGLLHLEVVQERLHREYGIELVVTVPSVAYQIRLRKGNLIVVKSPQELPKPEETEEILEPIMKVDIFSPKDYLGNIMQLVSAKRGVYLNTEYLDESIAVLHYEVPLTALLVDFYDKLKSASSGYASMNYEFLRYQTTDIVKLDILIADEPVEALASLVYRDEAHRVGKKIVESLKDTLPKQMFVVKLQAAVSGRVIAAERLAAYRKDVTAKLYGGDYTRKRKLLEKQKKGKKKMMAHGQGKVNIPPEAFLAVLKR
ncbi:MAG: elongation factor 4 [Candidatus Buchananbacteria bacterium RIFCSPLOWO2_01_FULL_46_12]|uniref:Elongation factor 4 n=2 Tax=Candidatus Buchananiibacteriota TaxID=1817903 RepID=A0A1G1YS59_9BACT|nr:MAG: elongation factor 4 [Candidatus Buchananbacteria bacterium RIFCSPHIGHO2_01_FULL_44_11]OGY55183.1 MAG: elongation factor 4 [Candidatus Buchananbacteria bacterium RIFCSPLOWO2_01_FULL_46_12]